MKPKFEKETFCYEFAGVPPFLGLKYIRTLQKEAVFANEIRGYYALSKIPLKESNLT
jgi:hypothetical protein